jgi:hypothetical protein
MKSSEKTSYCHPFFASISQLADTRKKDTPAKKTISQFFQLYLLQIANS